MSPGSVLLRLVVRAAIAACLVSLVSWTLVECAPGSTAYRAAVASRTIEPGDVGTTPEQQTVITAAVAKRHGLDDSFLLRITHNLHGTLRLRFGRSWRDEAPISSMLWKRGGTTLLLAGLALLLAAGLGILGALVSARRPQSLVDRGWAIYTAIALSVPIPWIALVSIRSFAYGHPFELLPPGGLGTPLHWVLPICVLAAAPAAIFWRHARQELGAVAAMPWVLAARATGISDNSLWRRAILRAALPAILALIPAMLAYLIAASVIVERVFVIEGVGELVAIAAAAGDAPVLIAVAAVTAALVSASGSLVDATNRYLDPRRVSD